MSVEFPGATTADALPDEEVVRRVRAGETALYELLMRRYNARIYRVARAILKNDGEAEDVMQDAYVRAFQNLHQFAGRATFSTWLTSIAVNEALARLRSSKRMEGWDHMEESRQTRIETAQAGPDPESQAASEEMRRLLEAAIEGLPEQFRAVVVLRDVEGMNTADTAACLSLSEENVKVRLHRAHGLLRKELYAKAGLSAREAFPYHASRCDRMVAQVFARLAAL